MMIAIDPGSTHSAYVRMLGNRLAEFSKEPNESVVKFIKQYPRYQVVIEQIASYGMAVGESVFETCVWSGRFIEAAGSDRVVRIKRIEVKNHLCHSSKANDANIRQALIDRYGGKEHAIGRRGEKWKKAEQTRGPLYGLAADCWAALAVGCTYLDRISGELK